MPLLLLHTRAACLSRTRSRHPDRSLAGTPMPTTILPPEPATQRQRGDATSDQALGSGGLHRCGRWLLDYVPDASKLAEFEDLDDDTVRRRIAELVLVPEGITEDTYGTAYSVSSCGSTRSCGAEPGSKSAPPTGAGGGYAGSHSEPADLRPQAALGLLAGKLAATLEVRKHLDCGRYVSVHVHDGGQIVPGVSCPAHVILPHTCKARWCPRCHGIWAKKTAARMKSTLARFKWPLSVNLTMKNCPKGHLHEMWNDLRDSFRRLRRRKYWQDHVKGCITVRGLTYNHEAQTWHAHFHLLLDCRWLEPEIWRQEWVAASRGKGRRIGQIQRIKNCEREARHVVHGTKGDVDMIRKSIRDDVDVFDEAVCVCHGMQRLFCCCDTRLRKEPKSEAYCPYCDEPFRWKEWTRHLLSASELYRWIRHDTFHCFVGWARAPGVDMPPVRSVWNLQEIQN